MNWQLFLSDVSKTLENNPPDLKSDTFSSEFFSPPISDNEILKHEKRLNTVLPPSYREFLKTSNGFKQLNSFIWNIFPLDKVEWAQDFDEAFYMPHSMLPKSPSIPDEIYFIYGNEQDPITIRNEYLPKTLAISDWGDAAILLLNPQIKFGEEWEAWMYATWLPGAFRYRSFEELMNDQYKKYLSLLSKEK